MNIIEIENLTHRFATGRIALDGINLNVREGEFVVIAGCNGSGKTTLLRHLNGLLLPTSGTVDVVGISVAEHPAKARQVVGMVFQDADSQIIGETVYEDAAFGPENLKLSRQDINDRVAHALEAVHLTGLEDSLPYQLSGGQKRRLAIAGVLAMNPRILVFDEPFSNLDYPGVKQVLRRIVLLHRQGHTIILATHDLEKVLPYADRLIVMQNGKIVRDGIPAEVIVGIEDFGVRMPREVSPWIPD
jgi:biotin transport system ATP-binding protein